MGPGQPVSSVNVDTVLRGIAQARHVRSAGARRPRVGLTAVTDGADDSYGDEGSEEAVEETDGDGDGDELDAEIQESLDFLAAVAQLRKEFRKKGKGKKKIGKGAGHGQTSKPKGPGGASSGKCQWTGLDASGDPTCFKLKDNKKCPKKHTEEDLAQARAALQNKGLRASCRASTPSTRRRATASKPSCAPSALLVSLILVRRRPLRAIA